MLVVLCGLPSSGKSTLAKKLANEMQGRYFLEPEETQWPSWISEKGFDSYSALNWFRASRVPNYRKSAVLAKNEFIVFDTFYDVLIHYYIDDPSFEWLISKDDPYRSVVKATAKIDVESLPKPDLIVSLNISEEDWHVLQSRRNRDYDSNMDLINYFEMQKVIRNAAINYCKDKDVDFFEVTQKVDELDSIVDKIIEYINL